MEQLKTNLGGTDIYSPLKEIYHFYEKSYINLPKNIFILTDGEVENKKEILNLIEKNNLNFTVYSIGIGKYFDEDLIKNIGIIGKGNYNFCKDLNNLNSIIEINICKAVYPYSKNLKITSSLDDKNELKNDLIKNFRRKKIVNLNFITKSIEEKINVNSIILLI